MSYEKITTHEADAVARLPEQHKGKPKIEALVRIQAARMQKIEDVLFLVAGQRAIAGASGVQLDVIGRVLRQLREGMTDALYRRVLNAKLLVLRSHGLLEDLIAICLAVLVDGEAVTVGNLSVHVVPYYPAALVIRLTGTIPSDTAIFERLFAFLEKAASGGVRVMLEWNPSGDSNTLTWGVDVVGQRWGSGMWADARG